MTHTTLPAEVLLRAQALLASGQRKILGIAAAPGAGKSTLAEGLLLALGDKVQVVPMDGFHLANSELHRLGRAGRKGAPDTFDAAGYVNLLHRIRNQQPGETIYAPEFRRDLEEGIAGAVAIEASTQLIITEGNYLLMEDGAWAGVRALLDEAWYLDIAHSLRHQRLLERHVRFGRSHQQALDWIEQTDEPNAIRIAATRHRASWVVQS
ncbi:nucleoside/nucleotide kinase family protein [Rhodoferax sp. GW822-FHT02A01]|uniref:nucleoside/nucleotide kinase family protein n=1 Tax=Rhodoferax sp. GW822-FHT02A01 TaxID=3141537 RepID=UPI00315DECF8